MNGEDEALMVVRERSRRIVHTVFAVLALLSLGLGLIAHHAPHLLGITGDSSTGMANGFQLIGAAYTLTLFLWDWLMRADA